MKKTCFLLLLLFANVILAQEENQGQSIELPEFVITGQQNVNIKAMKKSKPGYVGIVTDNYLTPSVSPEQMSMSSISDPFNFEQNLFPKPEYVNGQLKIGVGINTLPIGNFKYNYANKNVILHTDVQGVNIREYKDYSDYNETGVGAGIDWFNQNDAKFLPGLRISANGNYLRNAYNFYGSFIPSTKRETEQIKGNLSFSSNLKKSFTYNFSFKGDQLKFKENDLQEQNATANVFMKFATTSFDFTASGYYQHQKLNNSFTTDTDFNTLNGKALAGFTLSNGIYFNVGVNYSKFDTTNFISPIGSIRVEVNPYFSIIAEYNPYAQLSTYKDFLKKNKFFAMNGMNNVFTEYKNNANLAFKYQFYKYFEINGGAKYYKADGYLYFEDITSFGVFDPLTANDVEVMNLYGNFLFHKGPNGIFYGEVEYNSAKFDGKNKVPYIPSIKAKASYTFNLIPQIRFNVNVDYMTKAYADVANQIELPACFDLGGLVGYKIFNSFEFTAEVQNILNKKNYKYLNYREKPFDVIVGINYTW